MTDAWMTPEGGTEMPPGPTVKLPDPIPVAHGRDVQTDARRMSEVDGGGGNIMDDRDLDDVGYLLDLDVDSLGQEKRAHGWVPIAQPHGDDGGPPPPKVTTAGTRGASSIRDVPDDGSMP